MKYSNSTCITRHRGHGSRFLVRCQHAPGSSQVRQRETSRVHVLFESRLLFSKLDVMFAGLVDLHCESRYLVLQSQQCKRTLTRRLEIGEYQGKW
jgi:hypothetical protein